MASIKNQLNNDGLNTDVNDAHVAHSGSRAPVNSGSRIDTPLIGTQGSIPILQVPISVPSGSVERPEKFNGMNFKRWQQKMLFYLTTLGLARFLTERVPDVKEQEQDVQTVSAIEAWKHLDFLCRNYVLNGLHDSLYDVYNKLKTSKELWESLDYKYKSEDAITKKFVVGRFLDFKMVDSKPVLSQVEEVQMIFNEIRDEGMIVSEAFQVASIIHLLPPTWKDFKNYLKHKLKEMNLEQLILRLRIEEDNRKSDRRVLVTSGAKANVVEHGKSFKNAKKDKKKLGANSGISKNKFHEKCFNCGKMCHKSRMKF